MTDSTPATGRHHSPRHRFVPLAWISGALAAGLLVLGASGTLSSWTTAIITNSSNTVATANAVILKETGPGGTPATCLSSDGGVSNTFTCGTINKYGGTTTPLNPGDTVSTTVTMANVGTASGTLKLKAAACTSTGGIAVGSTDICGILQVAVACPTGTPTYPATGTSTLTGFAAAAQSTVATLAPNATVACTFSVTLPATASPTYAGETATQQMTWTLA